MPVEAARRRQSEGGGRAGFGVLAVCASAGGVEALSYLFGHLPRELPVPVLVVQHLDPRHPSLLAAVLNRSGPLYVKEAEAHEQIEAGTVYLAPPDRHLLVGADHRLRLTDEPRTHFLRPSGDRLFSSVAESYGVHALAVVLTGSGSDGAQGAVEIRAAGGTVLVQDVNTAAFPGMPRSTVERGAADEVLQLQDLGPRVVELLAR